jgi:hypothetical protein
MRASHRLYVYSVAIHTNPHDGCWDSLLTSNYNSVLTRLIARKHSSDSHCLILSILLLAPPSKVQFSSESYFQTSILIPCSLVWVRDQSSNHIKNRENKEPRNKMGFRVTLI